jgi:hypothetical protein
MFPAGSSDAYMSLSGESHSKYPLHSEQASFLFWALPIANTWTTAPDFYLNALCGTVLSLSHDSSHPSQSFACIAAYSSRLCIGAMYSASSRGLVSVPGVWVPEELHHYAILIDKSDAVHSCKFYRDATLVDTQDVPSNWRGIFTVGTSYRAALEGSRIGQVPYANNTSVSASATDDVRIYSRILSLDELTKIMAFRGQDRVRASMDIRMCGIPKLNSSGAQYTGKRANYGNLRSFGAAVPASYTTQWPEGNFPRRHKRRR